MKTSNIIFGVLSVVSFFAAFALACVWDMPWQVQLATGVLAIIILVVFLVGLALQWTRHGLFKPQLISVKIK